jgi:hypothetical protein
MCGLAEYCCFLISLFNLANFFAAPNGSSRSSEKPEHLTGVPQAMQ